jgi:GTPase
MMNTGYRDRSPDGSPPPSPEHRSGYVAIIGRPNVGKSTLMNRFLDYRLAITSPKPQTTRNRIMGIRTLPGVQMIFVDTPGIHSAEGLFNRLMVAEAIRSLRDVDLALMIIEAGSSRRREDHDVLEHLRGLRIPALLVINKIDLVHKPTLLSLMEEFSGRYPFEAVIPVSALSGDGVDLLEREIVRRLPAGPQYYPEDQISDLPERFLAGEVIREKVFNLCGEEIPYAVAVVVDEFQERPAPKPIFIRATLFVEKESQKGIVIGAGGRMLKRIGKAAREDLQALLERAVYLELWVKVEKNWSKDERSLRRLGYR